MSEEIKKCLSCSSILTGRFCSSCGEKVVQDADFSMSKIVGDGFAAFTTLDNKFFRSFGALLFRPGFLSQEYIEGRRNKYMKPFQLYILCSIVLFIFVSDFDIVLVPAKWFFVDVYGWIPVGDLVRSKMLALDIPLEELKILYDTKVVNYSKIGIIVIVPLLAIFSYLVGRKKIPQFGKHLIITIHNFCFILLLITLTTTFFRSFNFGRSPLYITFLIITCYLALSFKRLLKLSNLNGFGIGVLNFIILFIILFLYRLYISLFTLWVL